MAKKLPKVKKYKLNSLNFYISKQLGNVPCCKPLSHFAREGNYDEQYKIFEKIRDHVDLKLTPRFDVAQIEADCIDDGVPPDVEEHL